MIVNIIDKRTNVYNIQCDAMYEDAWHDNSIPDATKFNKKKSDIGVDQLDQTTVVEALKHGESLPGEITVFLYDRGSNYKVYSYDSEGKKIERLSIPGHNIVDKYLYYKNHTGIVDYEKGKFVIKFYVNEKMFKKTSSSDKLQTTFESMVEKIETDQARDYCS